MRIVLCDDHRILGEALSAALGARGHETLAIATTISAGIEAITTHRPDVCLLDLHFPNHENGLDVARAVQAQRLGTKILVLSGVTDQATIAEAKDLGVAGFVRKDQIVEVIAEALEIVASGGTVFDSGLRRAGAPVTTLRRRSHITDLTPREYEVLNRIIEGQNTSQMAQEMTIATSTIRTYVGNVLNKLGAHSRLQAVAIASQDAFAQVRSSA